MSDGRDLPTSVRYIKLGEGGRWWRASHDREEIHAGWGSIPDDAIAERDYPRMERLLREQYGDRRGATQDYNQLRSLLDRPSQHIWCTFEAGYLWWCTATDEISVDPAGSQLASGHFHLKCDRPWSNRSVGGRLLSMADLPGNVTSTAGFRATTCEPAASVQIQRLISDEIDPDVAAAADAVKSHQDAVKTLVRKLSPKDFELLNDLLLARSGWSRIAKLGGATEGVDIEVENAATEEIAFVQIKSVASQSVLNDYIARFADRRDRYDRMIFAVHSVRGAIVVPDGLPVQVWDEEAIARRVVSTGLTQWLSNRL